MKDISHWVIQTHDFMIRAHYLENFALDLCVCFGNEEHYLDSALAFWLEVKENSKVSKRPADK